jgi:hypothetical protein
VIAVTLVAIPSLEYLQLSGLENVRNVFNPSMAGGLVNLQDLLIDDCSTLEVVVGKEEEVGGHGRKIDKTLLFPQLIKLQLGSLPKLKRFCHFTQPLEIPLLRAMGIADCPSMDAFSWGPVSVPNLSLPGISLNGDLNNAVQSLQKMSAIATEGAPHSQQQVPPTPLESQESSGMKRKIVIKVAMDGQKTRSKALKIVVGVPGVESAALARKDYIEVTGDGIDAVALIKLLRKKVGPSELISVGPVPKRQLWHGRTI